VNAEIAGNAGKSGSKFELLPFHFTAIPAIARDLGDFT